LGTTISSRRPLQLREVVSRAVLETLAFASDAPDPSSGSAVTVLLHALRPQLDPRRLAPEARDPVRLEVTYRLSKGPWLLGKLTWP
jgi:hypothetical protein